MLINKRVIAELNPCKERFENFANHYSNFEGNLKEFISLENITYSDKVWVATRLLKRPQLVKWGALCAQSVLHIFEAKFPNDKAPRVAIEATLAGVMTDEILENARKSRYTADAAYANANDADADAYAAAAAAAYAADAAADAAYAAYAAAYAAVAVAAAGDDDDYDD